MKNTPKVKAVVVTQRQRRLAIEMVKNGERAKPLTQKQVMVDVGYGKISKHPRKVMESIGYMQAIRDLGLTEDLVVSSLYEDIQKKPQNRVKELTLASSILGMIKREEVLDKPTNTTYNFLFSAETQASIKDIEDKIKERLLNS